MKHRPNRFAENLKNLRESRNISQTKLAESIHYSDRLFIRRWEKKERVPRLDDVILIAEFFDLTLDELVFGDDDSCGGSIAE